MAKKTMITELDETKISISEYPNNLDHYEFRFIIEDSDGTIRADEILTEDDVQMLSAMIR